MNDRIGPAGLSIFDADLDRRIAFRPQIIWI